MVGNKLDRDETVTQTMSTRTGTSYPSQVPTLFSRKSADVITPTEPEVVEETNARAKNYTPSKRELGVATPKRTGTPRRPGAIVPKTKEEAKEVRREATAERTRKRAAMMNGEEWALTPRDLGPERRLVRDIVDARRNLAEYGLYAVFAFVIASTISARNPNAAVLLEIVLLFVVFVVIVDSMFLSRKIKAVVGAKMPKSSLRGLSRYGIARSMQFRKMRIPKPQVERGHKF
jgi:hypothetical protein